MDRKSFISVLVGDAYPIAVDIEGGLSRRTWIARTVDVLPDKATLDAIARSLEDDAFSTIATEYASCATAESLAAARPSVGLTRLDERHLIVKTDFAVREKMIGASAWISQLGVLAEVDRQLRLDDLQGLPWDYWFFLRASRDVDTKSEPEDECPSD